MIRFINKNKTQIFRFIVVGAFSNILNFLVYKLIYIVTSNISLSSISGYFVGLLNSFLFSRNWVFSNNRYISLDKAFLMFALSYILGGIEMTVAINILYKFTNSNLAWFCGACLAAINNFLFSKYLIFKN